MRCGPGRYRRLMKCRLSRYMWGNNDMQCVGVIGDIVEGEYMQCVGVIGGIVEGEYLI